MTPSCVRDSQLARLWLDVKLAKAGFDPNQPRGKHGRWSAAGAAIGRAASAVGRVARAAAPYVVLGTLGAVGGLAVHQLAQETARVDRESRARWVSSPERMNRINEMRSQYARDVADAERHRAATAPPKIVEAARIIADAMPGNKASVPFMITTDMKQQLLDLGISREEIKRMTPAQAHARLAKARLIKLLEAA